MDQVNERACNLLENLAETLSRFSDEEDREQLLSIRESMKYFLSADARMEALNSEMNNAINEISKTASHDQAQAVVKNFEEAVERVAKIEVKEHEKLDSLSEKIDGGEDEDICMVKSRKNVIDPISKKRLVDPVKNSQCGHVYEKSVVLQLIKNNPRTRCPIPGCSSSFIQRKHLIADEEMKQYLNSQQLDASSSFSQSQVISLDDTL